MNINAICGNCRNKYKDHYFEFNRIFCFKDTTGDIFTREPSNLVLIDFIEERHPSSYKKYIKEWKKITNK